MITLRSPLTETRHEEMGFREKRNREPLPISPVARSICRNMIGKTLRTSVEAGGFLRGIPRGNERIIPVDEKGKWNITAACSRGHPQTQRGRTKTRPFRGSSPQLNGGQWLSPAKPEERLIAWYQGF